MRYPPRVRSFRCRPRSRRTALMPAMVSRSSAGRSSGTGVSWKNTAASTIQPSSPRATPSPTASKSGSSAVDQFG